MTTDLHDFGYRELDMLCDLLQALKSGLPSDFSDDGVVPAFNQDSGYVFLTNNDYDVCMDLDDGKLHSWYFLPGTGIEGFADELYVMFRDGDITDDDDLEYLADVFTYSDDADSDWADEVREALE